MRFAPGDILRGRTECWQSLASVLRFCRTEKFKRKATRHPITAHPQGPGIFGQGSWDAIDCDNCDAIYNKQITNLTDARDDAIKGALSKYDAKRTDTYQDYYNAVSLENARFNGDMAQADTDFLHEIYTECAGYSLGGADADWEKKYPNDEDSKYDRMDSELHLAQQRAVLEVFRPLWVHLGIFPEDEVNKKDETLNNGALLQMANDAHDKVKLGSKRYGTDNLKS